jgi:HPt (histidine-containing phosphotransfer) domain-containing protein
MLMADSQEDGALAPDSPKFDIDPEFLEVEVEALLELGDPEAALELVQMYEEATRDILAELEALVEKQDWRVTWQLLHKLKGSALSIGLTGVSRLIESLRNDPSSLHAYPTIVREISDSGVAQIMEHLTQHLTADAPREA